MYQSKREKSAREGTLSLAEVADEVGRLANVSVKISVVNALTPTKDHLSLWADVGNDTVWVKPTGIAAGSGGLIEYRLRGYLREEDKDEGTISAKAISDALLWARTIESALAAGLLAYATIRSLTPKDK